jgi:carboxymethylenebutenolidase
MTSIQDVTFGKLRAQLLHPEKKSQAGVLILPSRDGVGGSLDIVLKGIAGAGLTAFAWDPYTAYGTVSDDDKARISQKVQQDAVVELEHRQCLDYMQKELRLERIGTIGFCMGGRMGIVLAGDDERINAVYYPTIRIPMPANVKDIFAAAPKVRCPVEVHYPGKDILTTYESFQKLRAALESRKLLAATKTYYHPDATHSFFPEPHEPNEPDRIAGKLAWPGTLAFFRAALLGQ